MATVVPKGVWKRHFKITSRRIYCNRCRKRIASCTWYYSKIVGGYGHQKTVYYHEFCYEVLFHEC